MRHQAVHLPPFTSSSMRNPTQPQRLASAAAGAAPGTMADSDSDSDYVYFGSAIADEVESRGYRKPVQDPAATRNLPVHKQEVTDAEGRKRFHGAFTGGFSAGYFNTVGSEVGRFSLRQRPIGLLGEPSVRWSIDLPDLVNRARSRR